MAAILCVSLPSMVVSCRGSGRGQFSGRRLEGRFGISTLRRNFRGGVSKDVKVKVWVVRSSLETRQNVEASRKGAPLLLEGAVDGGAKWVALSDIWRTAAVKYGERVALVDPHRDPPAELVFNQVEQAILDFAEGLRAAGIQPNQTVALFAEKY